MSTAATSATSATNPPANPPANPPTTNQTATDQPATNPLSAIDDTAEKAANPVVTGLSLITSGIVSGISGISNAFRAKQVPAPDIKELREGISDEVLEEYILKKQFQLDLYQEYAEMKIKTDTDDPENINLENYNMIKIIFNFIYF